LPHSKEPAIGPYVEAFSKTHFNIILTSMSLTSQKWLLTIIYSNQNIASSSCFFHEYYKSVHSLALRFEHPKYTR
jgi:hypothetical protein